MRPGSRNGSEFTGRRRHGHRQPLPARHRARAGTGVESTYGDRTHRDDDSVAKLALAVGRTAARGGVTVILALAVDRTEVVLLTLRRLMEAHRIPRMPIYIDSPMALAARDIYRQAIQSGAGASRRANAAAGDQ